MEVGDPKHLQCSFLLGKKKWSAGKETSSMVTIPHAGMPIRRNLVTIPASASGQDHGGWHFPRIKETVHQFRGPCHTVRWRRQLRHGLTCDSGIHLRFVTMLRILIETFWENARLKLSIRWALSYLCDGLSESAHSTDQMMVAHGALEDVRWHVAYAHKVILEHLAHSGA